MFKVCQKKCDQCLFSPEKIVGNERKNQIVRECLSTNDYFVCHKHGISDGEGGTLGEKVCYRGFYDAYGPRIQIIRIAERLNFVEFVDEPKENLYD